MTKVSKEQSAGLANLTRPNVDVVVAVAVVVVLRASDISDEGGERLNFS